VNSGTNSFIPNENSPARRSSLEVAVPDRLPGAGDARLPDRVDAGEVARVRLRLDGDPDVGPLEVLHSRRIYPVELDVRATREKRLGHAFEPDPKLGMPAGAQHVAEDLAHERGACRGALDEHEVARLDAG
jgi:hypothetical protein